MDIFVKVVLLSCLVSTTKVKDIKAATAFKEDDPKIWGDKQLEQLFECASMSQAGLDGAKNLVVDLQEVLQKRWPASKVIRFGSTLAGVALSTSDVDCFVQLPSELSNTTLYEARDLLAAHPWLFHNVNPLPDAPSPIVQFVHVPSGHRADMGFLRPDLVNSARLLRYLVNLDERARRLAVIVKYWASMNRPAGSPKIMFNSNIVTLVIFYLQQKHILPSIAMLQDNLHEHVIIDNWETGYNEIPYRTSNNDTLLELLSGFFEFYAHFDFENNVISTYSGTAIERRLFEQLDSVPDIFDTYKRNVARNITTPLNTKIPLCIQNCFMHSWNDCFNTTQTLLDRFRSNLKYASKIDVHQYNHSLKYIFNGSKCLRF